MQYSLLERETNMASKAWFRGKKNQNNLHVAYSNWGGDDPRQSGIRSGCQHVILWANASVLSPKSLEEIIIIIMIISAKIIHKLWYAALDEIFKLHPSCQSWHFRHFSISMDRLDKSLLSDMVIGGFSRILLLHNAAQMDEYMSTDSWMPCRGGLNEAMKLYT